jgi:hydroxymethylpyrimidine/phosphomethylpyrimidine kinase
VRVALSVAGSDSGGGAGVQADLKTFFRFGVYGATALTLVSAQNTLGIQRLYPLPPELVAEQIQSVAEDLRPHAAKTGALGGAEVVEAVAFALARHRIAPLVVDPVMVAKGGEALLDPQAVEALKAKLFPLATLITPNRLEAERLLGGRIGGLEAAEEAARALLALGPAAVLLKGGHLEGPFATDILATREGLRRYRAHRLPTRHTHGTGCTLSAAITALLARGKPLQESVRQAKAYLTRALARAPGLGQGHGPLNHWA